MSQDHNPWRDKYRAALTQQEQLEQTLSAQQALLHRTVIALSSAAEGYDSEIDKRLSAIRASLKSNDVGGFDRMIKSLDRIILEANKRQQNQWSDIHKGLSQLAEQLSTIKQSSDTGSAIKRYKKSIPKGVLLPATLKRLLEDLGHLQHQAQQEALSDGSITKKGFLGGLLSRKSSGNIEELTPLTSEASDSTELIAEPIEEGQWETVPDDEAYSLVAELVEDTTPRYRERRIPEAEMQRPVHEPAFSKISDRVTIILIELLDHFPTVPCVEKKAAKARDRIDKGLNWYELAPTLEDIRDFVIQAYMGADDNYRIYLKNVYDELGEITQALGLAIETEYEQRKAMDTLHDNINTSVQNITQALIENEEVNALKTAVNTQMKSIQSALKESRQTVSEGVSLSSQLSALIDKVKDMEAQEADVREQLEQERLRAVTDSLTGLPNREAYSERIHEEMIRWKRYRHPLCLAVIDIDFFKKINDNYGHATGDKVLKAVSSAVSQRLREVDFMARFGGEEFVTILPETSAEDALTLLNRIRERLSKAQMRSKDSKFNVTVSIGIAEFKDDDTAEEVFERADQALYAAKENGRNQCRLD